MAAAGHSPFNQSSSVKSRILRGALYYSPDLKECRKILKRKEKKKQIKKMAAKISKKEKAKLKEGGEIFRYIEIGDVTPYGLIVSHVEGSFNELPSRGEYQIRKGDVLIAI